MRCHGIVPTAISHNAVISSCDGEDRWPVALNVLDQMPDGLADTISFNSAVSACSRANRAWALALALGSEMAPRLLPLDEFTFGSLLLVSEQSRWTLALQICRDMNLMRLRANLFTYSAAISACQDVWQQAILLLDAMEEGSIVPNAVCYTTAMNACEKGGQWERALAIYQRVMDRKEEEEARGFRSSRDGRDQLLCDAALRAFEQGMQWQGALSLIVEMSSIGLKPDSLCFASVIGACTKAHEAQSALNIVGEMWKLGKADDFQRAYYKHSTQAGSTLDCFKHSVLSAVMQCMNADPRPYTYVDTHAGAAVYSLGSARQYLVMGLLNCGQPLPWHLTSYLSAVRNFVSSGDTLAPIASTALYPGSPLVALQWMRPQDDALLFELAPDIFTQLKANVQQFSSAQVEALQQNSFWWLSQHLRNQPDGRRLVLIDPPYAPYETYMAWSLFLVQQLYNAWPSSSIMLWYPYLDEAQVNSLYERVKSLEFEDVLIAEFGITNTTSSLETSGQAVSRIKRAASLLCFSKQSFMSVIW